MNGLRGLTLLALFIVSAPVTALAQQAQVLPSKEARAAQAANRAPRLHEGFRIRADAGFGILSVKSSAPARSNRSFTGNTFSWGLSIGGGVGRTCTLGGTITGDRVYGLAGYDQTSGPMEVESIHFSHLLFGPSADCYLTREGGFRLFGAIGVARLTVRSDDENSSSSDPTPDATGIGYILGAGYDAWIADFASLGIVFRVTMAPLSVDEVTGVETRVNQLVPMLGLSLAFE